MDGCDELIGFKTLASFFADEPNKKASITHRVFELFAEYFPQIAICPSVDPVSSQVCKTVVYIPNGSLTEEKTKQALQRGGGGLVFNGALKADCCFAVRCPTCVERPYPDLSGKYAMKLPYHRISGLPTTEPYNAFHRAVHAYFCRNCGSLPHFPASCQQTTDFVRQIQTDGASLALITRKCTQCPSCKKYVERSTGCNHMTCICKYEFCYVCGGAWKEHLNGVYYRCKKSKVQVDTMSFVSAYESFQKHLISADLDLVYIEGLLTDVQAQEQACMYVQLPASSQETLMTPYVMRILFDRIKNTLVVARLLIAFGEVKVFSEKIDERNMNRASKYHLFTLRKGMILKETETLSSYLHNISVGEMVQYNDMVVTLEAVKKWCYSLDAS
ncbi:ariadne-1 [Strigomonas culicis]|uniref:Ariadne-1 n=1 Tax=Strigomonas culicis TaxID=28005 RepID=S9VLZ3_9TRYP|nr:ariadne-1 [Strigomonas culicis]|eukprot:EPY28126.1 ariadne-1 [Strigomonas culicis]